MLENIAFCSKYEFDSMFEKNGYYYKFNVFDVKALYNFRTWRVFMLFFC